eukprot:45575-Rhodomonas_salina.1
MPCPVRGGSKRRGGESHCGRGAAETWMQRPMAEDVLGIRCDGVRGGTGGEIKPAAANYRGERDHDPLLPERDFKGGGKEEPAWKASERWRRDEEAGFSNGSLWSRRSRGAGICVRGLRQR